MRKQTFFTIIPGFQRAAGMRACVMAGALLSIVFLSPATAKADGLVYQFVGLPGASWSDHNNWRVNNQIPDYPPSGGDIVFFGDVLYDVPYVVGNSTVYEMLYVNGPFEEASPYPPMKSNGLTVGAGNIGSFTHSAGDHTFDGSVHLGDYGGHGTYTISGGSMSAVTLAVGFNDSEGYFEQSGGTVTVASLILRDGVAGVYTLSSGTLNVTGDEEIWTSHASESNLFEQTGGTHSVAGKLTIHGKFKMSGGGLTVVQDVAIGGGLAGSSEGLDVSGGTTAIDGILSLNDGPVAQSSGSVEATLISITEGSTYSWSGGTVHPGSLYIRGSMVLSAGGDKLLDVTDSSELHPVNLHTGLSILDVNDNDMIVRSTSSNRSTVLADIESYVRSGRNGGLWTGKGITSTAAANSDYTSIGVIVNDKAYPNGTPVPVKTTFDGVSVGVNDILVKYTWEGDADLSGRINADDYFRIDEGFLNQLNGWWHGDFNYDGRVNADDYFLIDQAYLHQGGVTLSGDVRAVAVPEPAFVGLSTIAGAVLSARRARKR